MAIDHDMLDQLLAGRDPQDLFEGRSARELKKALSKWMPPAELDDRLENEGAAGAINRRNGSSRKTVLTGTSKVTLAVSRDKAVYIALGIQPDDTKEVLGIWLEQTEGAKFRFRVKNELKNRGVRMETAAAKVE